MSNELFTLEQSFACQTVIEDLNWSYRIWPEANNSGKPTRPEVVSNQQILQRVLDLKRMEMAVAHYYGLKIQNELLQEELRRIKKHSKAPQRLEELFRALNDDPKLLAECIARPVLVKRSLYERFLRDKKIHHTVKKVAEQYLDPGLGGDTSGQTIPREITTTIEIRNSLESYDSMPEINEGMKNKGRTIVVDEDEFEEHFFRITGKTLPVDQDIREMTPLKGELRETSTSFVFEEIVSFSSNRFTIRALIWDKLSFSTWWRDVAPNFNIDDQPAANSLANPLIPQIAHSPSFIKEPALNNASFQITADTWQPGALSNIPINYTTAVWTGNEMLVWGGNDENHTAIGEGARYDPVTDQWSPMSSVGAPIPRIAHTAVWTGTELIIWGGFAPSIGNTDSGGRYNPATDSWQPTTNVNAPSSREYHTAIWSGGEMIVWGGYAAPERSSTITGGRYNPANDSWSPTSTTNVSIDAIHHTAVWTGTEMIVWGGSQFIDRNFYRTNLGSKYNPATDSWVATATSNAPTVRQNHSAVWSGSEMIIWGGDGNHSGGRYDPITDTWVETRTYLAPTGRSGHSAIWTGSEMIVYGGPNSSTSNTGGRYDPVTNSWQSLSTDNSHPAGTTHSMVWTGDEMIVWGGGTTHSGGRYTPSTDTWRIFTTTGEPLGRSNHTAVWTGSEMIVWGGRSYENNGGIYNPVTDSWNNITTLNAPVGRYAHSAIWSGTEMIIWGGRIDNYTSTNTGGRYNPSMDSWAHTTLSDAPSSRDSHTAVWTGTEMIIWGGENLSNSGGRYNPEADSWNATSTTGAPLGRYLHSAIWTGIEMIVWGGYRAGQLQDGARYYPLTNTWQPTETTGAPSGRSRHTAIWTGAEMIVWGGKDAFGLPPTGGRFNPTTDTWIDTDISGSPTERQYHTAVWTGTEMIIWGGENSSLLYLNTGSRYSPSTNSWTPTTTTGAPPARRDHTAVWSGREMIVWGGGSVGASQLWRYYPYSLYKVGGSVDGLAAGNSLVLQNNATDDLTVEDNGGFVFQGLLPDESAYDVTVVEVTGPTGQSCLVTNGIGFISGADISSVEVACSDQIQPGDVNGNGTVSLEDAVLSLQVVSGFSPSGITPEADVNGDSRIGIAESLYILNELNQ